MLWAQLDPVWYKSNRNFTHIVSTVYLLTVLIIAFVPQGMNSIVVTGSSNIIYLSSSPSVRNAEGLFLVCL